LPRGDDPDPPSVVGSGAAGPAEFQAKRCRKGSWPGAGRNGSGSGARGAGAGEPLAPAGAIQDRLAWPAGWAGAAGPGRTPGGGMSDRCRPVGPNADARPRFATGSPSAEGYGDPFTAAGTCWPAMADGPGSPARTITLCGSSTMAVVPP